MKRIVLAVLSLAVLCSLLICLAGCVVKAELGAEKSIVIKGEKYIEISIGFTKEGKTIARAGSFDINEIPEDKSHNFLAVRSFLDDWTVVKESYIIPTSGKLNVAYCDHERITDGEKLRMVYSILDENYQGSFIIETDNRFDIFNATKSIQLGYEDCPVGTDWIGAIGNINGYLVFVKAEEMRNEDLQYTCYILQDEYQELYSDSVKNTFDAVNEKG